MITETAILNAETVNETRFQYYRNWSRSLGNELPEVNVANSFVTGGNGIGNTFDRTHHFELQNYTTRRQGKAYHQIRRARAAGQRSEQQSRRFQRRVHLSWAAMSRC